VVFNGIPLGEKDLEGKERLDFERKDEMGGVERSSYLENTNRTFLFAQKGRLEELVRGGYWKRRRDVAEGAGPRKEKTDREAMTSPTMGLQK